jgi:hypothetical protein
MNCIRRQDQSVAAAAMGQPAAFDFMHDIPISAQYPTEIDHWLGSSGNPLSHKALVFFGRCR